jgi:hypothetical protein
VGLYLDFSLYRKNRALRRVFGDEKKKEYEVGENYILRSFSIPALPFVWQG